ncbi:MAG: 50S ribosomal protein L15e [Candidatus Micrarchaeota archaeon]
MGAFKYIKNSFRESYAQRSEAYRARLRAWRKGESIARVEKPANPLRARELGYSAKREFVIVRVRVPRGKRRRNKPDQGRKPAKNRKFENPGKPWQWFAQQRALRRFPNLELVNSYWVGEDGTAAYYEVILRNAWSSKPKLNPKAVKKVQAVQAAVNAGGKAPKAKRKFW